LTGSSELKLETRRMPFLTGSSELKPEARRMPFLSTPLAIL